MKSWSVALFSAVFLLVGNARADIVAGTSELSLSGNFASANYEAGGSADIGSLSLGLGHFYANEIEVGVQAMGNWSENLDLYSFGGYYKYHFKPKLTTIPYLGVQLNYALYDSYARDEQGIMYGPLAGVRYFVSRSVSVFVEYQYQIYEGDINDVIEDAHGLFFGVLFKF